MNRVVIVEEILLWSSVRESLHRLDSPDEFDAITHTSFQSWADQVSSGSTLNTHDLREQGLIFKDAKFFQGIFVEHLEHPVDIVEVTILRVYVNW